MNITFTPDTPTPVTKDIVLINGKEVGTVTAYVPNYPEASPLRFQTQLKIPTAGGNLYPGGFGETKEISIEDAFANAHTMLVELTAWLDNTEVV